MHLSSMTNFMKRSFLTIALILISTLQTQAFEEYILSTESKLSKINVENKEILKVQPVITIDNSKNTLFITPLKVGETSFSVVKDSIEKISFNVKIDEEKISFSEKEGFNIMAFDTPPVILDCNLDKPPLIKTKPKTNCINIDGAIIEKNNMTNEEGE